VGLDIVEAKGGDEGWSIAQFLLFDPDPSVGLTKMSSGAIEERMEFFISYGICKLHEDEEKRKAEERKAEQREIRERNAEGGSKRTGRRSSRKGLKRLQDRRNGR
jgi:hypothetical protein